MPDAVDRAAAPQGNASMPPEQRLRETLARRPQKAGAFIVTLYGDVVVPRGGELWIGNIIETCAEIGINESLVRTSVSRLVSAGRLQGERVGRRSFYRLTEAARAEFARAAEILFAPPRQREARGWRIVWLPPTARSDAMSELTEAGFGRLGTRLAIAPEPEARQGSSLDAQTAGLTFHGDILTGADPGMLRALAAESWPLGPLACAYEDFIALFSPLAALSDRRMARLPGRLCLIARLVLVNEFRHMALSDPNLPDAARPPDWPGDAARRLFARLYCRLSDAADSHVARHFIDSQGRLRDRSGAVAARIEALSRF